MRSLLIHKGLWSERTYASLNAHHCNARDVLHVLYACLDRHFGVPEASPFLVLGPIAQARIQNNRYKDLAQYLLLLDGKDEYLAQANVPMETLDEMASERQPSQLETRILEFCQTEIEKTKTGWEEITETNPQGITSDMMRIITNLCITAAAVTTFGDAHDRRVSTLESSVNELSQLFVSTLAKPQTEQYKIDAVLESCTKSLPNIRCSSRLTPYIFRQAGVYLLSQHLSGTLSGSREVKQSFYAGDEDFMDVDENDSQLTFNAGPSDADVPRHTVQAETDIAALRASCLSYLRLVSAISDSDGQDQGCLPSVFVDYMISLPESELLHSRQLIRSLLNSGIQLSRNDCLNLLERLSEALIDPRAREYNTSEVANGMVVEVLIGTALVWDPDATDREAQDLYENVEGLYAYYVKDMKKGGVRQSASLQNDIAIFLHSLLKHHPNFGKVRNVSSVRTSLFELLSQGEMAVKYQIAERLPLMFEDFVLSEHDKILQDVDSSLPGEDEGLEGIAVRLLVLSKLASKWHTLLRSSVYRIFATAGSVKHAVRHAQRCIQQVAHAKGIASSQKLFRLFAPQIIYTWLDRDRKFADIPFLVFGYVTLADLLRDVESEAVGQAMSRGLKDELNYLAKQLGISMTDMLVSNIGKAAAYTISWDTCKGSVRNKAEPSYANLLKDLITNDKYYSLIQKQFPQVLSCIFQTIDHEERINKSLDKKPAFTPAAKTLIEMTNIGHSPQDLNIGIEPSFNAFYLPDQLERLCRRSGDDPASFWSPTNYTYVMRTLLDRIHPALGSLYARSIIRKIRIVVALAGPVAYEGYPLQMTLQSLRPFLTDIQCAEDTVGIMQYLFEHGSQYLREHLSFVTGIGLSILISVRVFTGSTQDSTTQQSQHIATMNTANRFHVWLTEYLKSHAEAISSSEKSSSVKTFKSIITAASQVHAEGNSFRGSEESRLLLEILNDGRSGRKLLNKTSREVALNLLCQNFQPAATARDDVLGKDKEAAEYASLIWESCQRGNVGDGYLLWTARVLGRAYSAYGEVKQSTTQTRHWLSSNKTSKDSSGKYSRETIVKEVIDLFYSDERSEVSLAENAARRLISRLPGKPAYETEMFNTIPTAIGKALTLYIPDESAPAFSTPSEGLEHAAAPTQNKSVAVWIRDLAVALCQVADGDPILGALSGLLVGIEYMAERLFPYILHLVLLAEFDEERSVREIMSEATMSWFCCSDSSNTPYVRILIQSILYLRSQPVPNEITRVDRDRWLEIDYLKASHAATVCGMYRSALLFAETSSGQPMVKSTSRRSSILVPAPTLPTDLQLSIYKNLDEPDSFYGVDRGSSLSAVLDRLDYEGDGVKTLLFRGARLDSQMRRQNEFESTDTRGTIKSLIMLNMNSVTYSLLSNDQFRDMGEDVVESTLHTARKLGQWDIKAPEMDHTEPSVLFKAFQGLHVAKNVDDAKENFNRQLLATMSFLTGRITSSTPTNIRLRTLAALTEADEVIRADHPDHLLDIWEQMRFRESWMQAGE
jgi:ataxia telangiectasia mutated family protein